MNRVNDRDFVRVCLMMGLVRRNLNPPKGPWEIGYPVRYTIEKEEIDSDLIWDICREQGVIIGGTGENTCLTKRE